VITVGMRVMKAGVMPRASTEALVSPGANGIWRAPAAVPRPGRPALAVLPLLAVAFAVGCRPRSTVTDAGGASSIASASVATAAGAVAVFDDIHAAACAGDADKFFAHVAEATLLDNVAKRIDGGAQSQAIAKTDLDAWRKDIKDKGKLGNICAWTFVASEKIGAAQRLQARSKTGDKRFLFFADVGGQLKLVDYQADGAGLIAPTEPVEMTVDVAELLKDYKGNELRGDAKYKGKRLRVIGKAGDMKRDLTNTIFMTVGTGVPFETPEAQCFFADEYASSVASLTKGDTVVVNCTVAGLMMNVLMKDCAFPSVATLNACYKLQNAGIAKQCIPMNEPMEETAFYTSPMPPNLSEEKATAFAERTVGMIVLLRDEASYEAYVARTDANTAVGKGVGSPSARVIVMLPRAAPSDLEQRVKTVVDHLAPASK
jgi:hypothetical protein